MEEATLSWIWRQYTHVAWSSNCSSFFLPCRHWKRMQCHVTEGAHSQRSLKERGKWWHGDSVKDFWWIVGEAFLAWLKQTAGQLFRGEEGWGGGVSRRWGFWESGWWLRGGEKEVFVCTLFFLWTCLPVLTALAVSISPALNIKWPLSWISSVDHHWRADAATVECL